MSRSRTSASARARATRCTTSSAAAAIPGPAGATSSTSTRTRCLHMSSVLSESKATGEVLPPAAEHAPDQALWYKDAVIYQLHVKAFHDSNNDGIGDFRGLTAKLD